MYVKDIGALLSENVGSGTQCRTLTFPKLIKVLKICTLTMDQKRPLN